MWRLVCEPAFYFHQELALPTPAREKVPCPLRERIVGERFIRLASEALPSGFGTRITSIILRDPRALL